MVCRMRQEARKMIFIKFSGFLEMYSRTDGLGRKHRLHERYKKF